MPYLAPEARDGASIFVVLFSSMSLLLVNFSEYMAMTHLFIVTDY